VMPNLIAIESFTTPWEAHIARGRLEAEGIPVCLAGEHHVGAFWPISQALGGVRLLVPATAAVDAASVMRAYRSGAYQAALESELDLAQPTCPHCGASSLEPYLTKLSMLLAFASWAWFGITFPPKQHGNRCTTCRRRSPY
jgi:hypothetical protein